MQNLIPLFPQSTTYIRDVIEKNGKILVCCNGGMSRSPAFVIAYTMETFGLNAVQAYQYVQSRRLCINPNETFRSQLGVGRNGNQFCQSNCICPYRNTNPSTKPGRLTAFPPPPTAMNSKTEGDGGQAQIIYPKAIPKDGPRVTFWIWVLLWIYDAL